MTRVGKYHITVVCVFNIVTILYSYNSCVEHMGKEIEDWWTSAIRGTRKMLPVDATAVERVITPKSRKEWTMKLYLSTVSLPD